MYQHKLQNQLQARIIIQPDTQCWEWQGQISNSGRGRIMIQSEDGTTRTVSAEDASYLAFIGAIPPKTLVQQSCGNRLCINPEHLALMELP